MYIRTALYILTLTAGLLGAPCFADTVTVDPIQTDNSHNVLLKKIVQKIGNRLRALVIDGEGNEQHIFISGEDAIEIKRGLWVIRPGTYQIAI